MSVRRTPGLAVWRELLTADVEKAKGFYGELFGWRFQDMPMPDGTYTVISGAKREIAGVMQLPMPELPTHWNTYISVEDVAATAKAVTSGGGTLFYGPAEIPEVGTLLTFADDSGAVMSAMCALSGDPEVAAQPSPGDFCWETLSTQDKARALAFYGKVFGWKPQPGPGGEGSVFATDSGTMVADLQVMEGVAPHWLTYVLVESLDASRTRAEKLGGSVTVPRIEVPTVGSISVIQDPAGAYLGLFQPLPG
ncbi:MAG: VOC family protein [Polyangiaceae bacterium]|nr:VOC family protein [Polyangiaceae bacterium]